MNLAMASVAFAVGAGLCVLPLVPGLTSGGAGWSRLPFIVVACAAVVGPLFWLVGVVQPASTSLWRGAVTGLAVAITAHVLSWYVMSVMAWLIDRRDSLGAPLLNPVDSLPGALLFSAASLLLVPWSLPVGALVGVLLLRSQR
jgi:membrane-bound metal-dependent hydrolase YbcI (DUF457 family)